MSEPFAEQLSRVRLMADGNSGTWDLSLNDTMALRALLARLDQVETENARLKRGDFTAEEFQGLCHHRDERPGCTALDFMRGCAEYQDKLFGTSGP